MWWSLVALFTIATLTFAFETAMHFKGSAIDGPFQLYNALRRIQAGFRPGTDFQYFHGLGIPYSHYWMYRLLGGGLRGSELARELMTAGVYPLVYLAVFRAFSRDWLTSACLTALTMAAAYLLKMSPLIFAVNGMLGLRSALPTLLPVALIIIGDRWRRTVVAGTMLGAALFMSTEQGLAALLAYILVAALLGARADAWRDAATEAVLAIAVAVVTLSLMLVSVGGIAGLRGALAYNFRAVPSDQYWYFGAPPNVFVPSWSAGIRMVFATPMIAIAIFGSLGFAIYLGYGAWHARTRRESRTVALLFLSTYGLVSCGSLLGVFTPAYIYPCWRALLIVAVVLSVDYFRSVDTRRARASWLGVPREIAAVTGICAVTTIFTVRLIPLTLSISVPHVVTDHMFGSAAFGVDGIWPATLSRSQQVINAHRAPDGRPPIMWSTYSGWAEARAGIFHPATDYIIHALGRGAREQYVERFRASEPTLVQTVRPTYTRYETWIENNHWRFYDELLRDYRVIGMTPWSIFWERRASPLAEPPVVATLVPAPGAMSVSFNVPPAGGAPQLLAIEVDYVTHNALQSVPLVGMTPRYLIGIQGALFEDAISLEPYATTKSFPLLVRGGTSVTLSFGTFGLLPGAGWQPKQLRIREWQLDDGAAPWMSDLRVRAMRAPPPL